MKKKNKICLGIACGVVAIVVTLVVSLDMVVLHVAREQLSKLNTAERTISLSGVHVSLLAQSISLYGVDWQSGAENEIGYTNMHVAQVHANHVNVLRALREKHIELHDVGIRKIDINAIVPHAEGQMQIVAQGVDVELRSIGYTDTLRVDSINIGMNAIAMHLSKYHAPDHPYGMPQEGLAKLSMPIRIGRLALDADQLDFALTTQEVSYASISTTRVHALSRNIENVRGGRITLHADAHMAQGGHAWLGMTMVQNKACNVDFDMLVVNAKGSALDGMLRPLVGLTMECTIDTLRTKLSGDKTGVDGEFMMRYHDLAVTAHKGESPYEIVNKNAGAINSVANTLLPKANPNPLTPNNVRQYHVHADRNPMKPFPLMPIMAMVDGIKDTMLPGLFVHKKVKTKSTPTNSRTIEPKRSMH